MKLTSHQLMLQDFIKKLFNGDSDFTLEIINDKIFMFWPDGSRVFFSREEWGSILEQAKISEDLYNSLELIWVTAESKSSD